ncbi:hypothetical protein QUF79_10470 [Fictibacillus enclensis]|uniref:hypothetical protein n=1 Tax=Fictibacillus enclensis TaxID=1017270 RepID=UPI0025A087A0|nr:hypothetical protein [Fictibacillus enclensis]MDM5198440.1 hypothetical protein [Fictibacillus enclensis]
MKKENSHLKISLLNKAGKTYVHPDDLPSVLNLLHSASEAGLAVKIEYFDDILAYRTATSVVGETILSVNKSTHETLFFGPYTFKNLAHSLNIQLSYQK